MPSSDVEARAEIRQRLKDKLRASIRTGEITLSSGGVTDFYFDGRQVSLDPEGSVLLATLFLDEIVERGIQAVGGPTSGADPLTSSIGVLAWQRGVPLRLFFVRKAVKEHGTRQLVEGPPIPREGELEVALVDDALTTGGSLVRARDSFAGETGRRPGTALVIVDREEGGRERLESEGMRVVSLFRKSDFT